MISALTELTRQRWFAPLYGGVVIAIGVGQMMRKMMTDTGGFGSRYALVLFGAIVTVGLVARSYGRGFGSPWLWRAVFLVLILVLLALLGFGVTMAMGGSWPTAGLCLGGAVLLAPAGAGIGDYAFASPGLWRGRGNDKDGG